MDKNREKWFLAIASNDLIAIDHMLEKGYKVNVLNDEQQSALQIVAKKLSASILELDWDAEKLLKEISATLVIHGANQEDLGHGGGDACDISRAITIHTIKLATKKGRLESINKMIENGDIWFPEKLISGKEQFLRAVNRKDIFSIEKMFNYDLIGFPPSQ